MCMHTYFQYPEALYHILNLIRASQLFDWTSAGRPGNTSCPSSCGQPHEGDQVTSDGLLNPPSRAAFGPFCSICVFTW